MARKTYFFVTILGLFCIAAGCSSQVSSQDPGSNSEPETNGAAVETIEGGIITGQSVQLLGSHFGNKTPAAPVLFDDFENGSPGERVFGYPGSPWTAEDGYSGYAPAVYDDSFSSQGRNLVAKFDHVMGANITSLHFNFQATGKWLLDADVKMDFLDEVNPYANNIKLFRFRRQSNPGITLYPSFNGLGNCDSTGMQTGGIGVDNPLAAEECITNEPRLPSSTYYFSEPRGWINLLDWMDFQFLIGGGTPGERSYTSWITMNAEVKNSADNLCLLESGGENYDQLTIGHQAADAPYGECPQHTPSEGDVASINYWDNVYFDTTWQRIEIGDSAIYENCTHRTIQIPSAWTDAEITFTARTDGFTAGDDAWIFIIDENNVPSAGISTTIAEP